MTGKEPRWSQLQFLQNAFIFLSAMLLIVSYFLLVHGLSLSLAF